MALTSKSPLRFAGAVVNSGNVNTGEQNMTLGGAQVITLYSGQLDPGLSGGLKAAYVAGNPVTNSGSDIFIASGAGRLKDVVMHGGTAVSGSVKATFYDASVVVSGGPFPASGHKILAVIGTSLLSGFQFGPTGFAAGTTFSLDVPYTSGLCLQTVSGFPGLTVTFTPEAQPSLANPG